MRKHYLLFLAIVAFPFLGMAADTTFVASTIDKVTLYFNGAVVERTASLNLPAGNHVLVLHGLTAQLDPQSVNVGTALPIDILSIQHQVIMAAGTTYESLRRNSRVSERERLTIKAIEDSVKAIHDAGKGLDNELAVLALEETMLNENSTLVDKKNGTTLKEIAETAAFLRSRLTAIRAERQKLMRQRDDLEVQLNRLNFALNEALHPIKEARSEVVLQALAEETVKGKLTLRYFVGAAAWTPGYDFKVESVAKPMEILYKATVIQTTGEDWRDVELVLSTANPKLSNEMPVRQRWDATRSFPYTTQSAKPSRGLKPGTLSGEVTDAQTSEPLPFVNIVVWQNGVQVTGTTTDFDGKFRLGPIQPGSYDVMASFVGYDHSWKKNVAVRDEVGAIVNFDLTSGIELEEVMVVAYEVPLISRDGGASGSRIIREEIQRMPGREATSLAQTVAGIDQSRYGSSNIVFNDVKGRLSENLGSMEYTLKSRHTLPSDGRDHALKIREIAVSAEYEHRVLPIASTDVFLSAKVGQWSALNLTPGMANVYFGNTYTGQVMINPVGFEDTLKVALGRDPGIHCKRELDRTLTTRQALATGVKETVAYTITVRNTTGTPVNLVVEDQYPISPYKQYPSTLESAIGAEVDENSGFLTWTAELQSNETQVFDFSYTVKSPR
jgi:hypothetical protein